MFITSGQLRETREIIEVIRYRSSDAFSSNLVIMSLIEPLTFAKGSLPLEVSACIAKTTWDASCVNPIEFSLLVSSFAQPPLDDSIDRCLGIQSHLSSLRSRPSPSQAPPIPQIDSCCRSRNPRLLSGRPSNLALCSSRIFSVISKSVMSVVSWSSSSRIGCLWLCRVILSLSSDYPESRPGIRPTTVSAPKSLGGWRAINERESIWVLASVLDRWDWASSLFSWITVPCAALAFVSSATAVVVVSLATAE